MHFPASVTYMYKGVQFQGKPTVLRWNCSLLRGMAIEWFCGGRGRTLRETSA